LQSAAVRSTERNKIRHITAPNSAAAHVLFIVATPAIGEAHSNLSRWESAFQHQPMAIAFLP